MRLSNSTTPSVRTRLLSGLAGHALSTTFGENFGAVAEVVAFGADTFLRSYSPGVSLTPVPHVLRPPKAFPEPLVFPPSLRLAARLGAIVLLVLAVVVALGLLGAGAAVLAIAPMIAVET